MSAEESTARERPSFTGLLADAPRVIERHALVRLLERTKGLQRLPLTPHVADGTPEFDVSHRCDKLRAPVRVVCLSDTHDAHETLPLPLPPGDVLVHCGDASNDGTLDEIDAFAAWLGRAVLSAAESGHAFRDVVFVPGNHDRAFDASCDGVSTATAAAAEASIRRAVEGNGASCHVLSHGGPPATLACGLRVGGSPFQPATLAEFAFGYARRDGHAVWRDVANAPVDVLVTHGPPLGFGDAIPRLGPAGCANLLDAVRHIKPLVHVFGHIHTGRGAATDGTTTYVNCANAPPGRADVAADEDDGDASEALSVVLRPATVVVLHPKP